MFSTPFISQARDERLPRAKRLALDQGQEDESDRSHSQVACSLPQGSHQQMEGFRGVWEGLPWKEVNVGGTKGALR